MNSKEKLVIITAIFVVIVAILGALSTLVVGLDVTTLPEWSQPIVRGLIGFFTATPVIFITSYFRNILGYLRNFISGQGTPATEYELARYRDTVVKYIAIIGPFAAAIPAPYTYLGTALGTVFALIVDITTSEWSKKTTTPPAT